MVKPLTNKSCFQCKFFNITHDRRRPYGCSSMGFKSKTLPSQQVTAIQGHACLAFSPKASSSAGIPLQPESQTHLVNLHL
jgi:hypothetical protein